MALLRYPAVAVGGPKMTTHKRFDQQLKSNPGTLSCAQPHNHLKTYLERSNSLTPSQAVLLKLLETHSWKAQAGKVGRCSSFLQVDSYFPREQFCASHLRIAQRDQKHRPLQIARVYNAIESTNNSSKVQSYFRLGTADRRYRRHIHRCTVTDAYRKPNTVNVGGE